MDGEKLKEQGEGQRRRFPLTGVSLLVLTLLLTAAVASLIYLSVNSQHVCRQLKEKEEKTDIEANINIKTNDDEKKENIKYSQMSRVAYYHGPDGSFGLDDFSKGIHIFKNLLDDVCYVIPVGANRNGDHDFEKLLKNNNGKGLHVNTTYSMEYKILPGQIEDVSMIPAGAHKECTNGYKWMIVTRSSSSGKNLRSKRSTTCRYCYYFYSTQLRSLYRGCFNLRYTLNFNKCPSLYNSGK